MDSVSLVERENEFKKLNKQLEKKTEMLMKEIEHAMAKKDIFSDFSTNLKLSPRDSKPTRHNCESISITSKGSPETSNTSTPKKTANKQKVTKKSNVNVKIEKNSDRVQAESACVSAQQCQWCTAPGHVDRELEFLYAFVSVNVKDDILPQSFMKEKITVESVCKCLAAKIKLLQKQIQQLQQSISGSGRQCAAHMRQLAELEGGRLELQAAAHSARAASADARAACRLLQDKLHEKEQQLREQRAAAEAQAGELRRLRARCGGLEARAAAHDELAAGLRQQLSAAGRAEKEQREAARAAAAAARAGAALQERRARELGAGVRRQARLVANLRRQLALRAAGAALAALDKDYNDFLTQEF